MKKAETTITTKNTQVHLHDVFSLAEKDSLSARGNPIPITVLDSDYPDMVPAINENYIFDARELKHVMSGVEINVPIYIWGHKGVGKTELVEQICARTRRPLVRVQHSLNTEEAHIVGQWLIKNGETVFEFCPLPLAMMNGWTYLADEYDFALPNVLAIYQAVLEGKPLFIKEADQSHRVIKPHPNFRFFATGNTNGVGDETGLYQGTSLQNAANYDRFAVVVNKSYLPETDEAKLLCEATHVQAKDANQLVNFANRVRASFENKKMSDTISPRTLIVATRLGMMHGSFVTGLTLAFINKLNVIDRQVCSELAQRFFGQSAL